MKGIPPDVAQHWTELNTSIPPIHQVRYRLNLNYATIVKQDINKLLIASFIKLVEKATWLSLVVVVLKKMENSEFVWTSKNLMQLLRKTHTHYLLLMRLLTLQLDMKFIHVWMVFPDTIIFP